MATKRKVSRAEGGSAPAGGERAAGAVTSLDVEALRQIVEMLEASDVTRLVWQRGDERLYIRRGHGPAPTIVHAAPVSPSVSPAPAVEYAAPAPARGTAAAPAPASAAPAAAAQKPGQVITSPFVGTFYRTPAPDQPSFVDVGTVVKKGQVLCIVEAMKLMNEIESEVAGRVAEILVENGQPVEFGQALFRIEPA
ncbi:acetyl-CoA carboxylase biotin carboxyl carrier protein [Stigmatella aurantiaca]|uniref:Biotin carboxyl carrier protein of acetyl-CoA carboxylase n=1 Tax=Stigmatella aurantiaca (strain DW4/3-1) TaxID=378806 RepID=Q08Z06_STIAD|nr:acetyl-CoA carboxylase biotin carboxyl carrier protein [Stigmatella aurantiaca]ADO74194.1 Acetyl-CoA carboxylase, biotin carboxyl carrier protein [Stigmatella aurantiaca DW4/3-1]EAU65694.1 acetyl-CoA carboxylase, biotin carboxyl carrier protein [Stigmatella aurantiaca DW4/3-1]